MKLSNLYEAFRLKLQFNLKAEASQNYLNYVWWLLEPALHVTVFYFIFDVLLRRGGEGFVVFLLCGQIPFLWFSRSVSNASNSIMNGRGLGDAQFVEGEFSHCPSLNFVVMRCARVARLSCLSRVCQRRSRVRG